MHSLSTTAANVHDVTEAHGLLHGGETQVWCDAGYQGVHKREENLGRGVEWQVAMRPGKRRKLEPESAEALAERNKASVRAKVEHPFLKVKRVFGYAKVRYRGPGEEHGASGAAFWLGQPADGGGPTDWLTWAQWAKSGRGPPEGPVKGLQRPRRSAMRGRHIWENSPGGRSISAKLPQYWHRQKTPALDVTCSEYS